MKKRMHLFFMILLLAAFLIPWVSPESRAQGYKGKWSFGLRAGPSFPVQEFSDNNRADPGWMVNGNISYGLTEKFMAGLDLEWERHSLNDSASGLNYGDATTVSVIPRVEYHFNGGSSFSPYLLLGAGVNLNSFDRSGNLQGCPGCKMDFETTLALKGGGGIDYLISPNVALNAELGLKMNDGTANISGSFGNYASGTSVDSRLCSLALVVGIRYYY